MPSVSYTDNEKDDQAPEHELELQLVSRIRDFLTEMGGTFMFVGNQYHLMAGDVYPG